MTTDRPTATNAVDDPTALDDQLFDVVVERGVRVPTAGEATLAADVYLPDAPGPFPALLTVLPYRADALGGMGVHAALQWFARRGYACLLVDLLGTGSSDGVMRPMMDADEGMDSLASIEWISHQDWCTGAVGIWGISYGAHTAMRAASLGHPALKAVMPMMGPLDPERDRAFPDGAAAAVGVVQQGGSNLMLQLLPPLRAFTDPDEHRRWYDRVQTSVPYILHLADLPAGHADWRRSAIDPSRITIPSLCVGGWRDLYGESMLRAFEQMAGPKKLLMGPWMHTFPHESPFESIDFLPVARRWWDAWLVGIDDGVMDEPPVVMYTLGHEPGWRAYPSWPPASSSPPATDALTLGTTRLGTYVSDPTAGMLSGLWGIPCTGWGLPLDQHSDDQRSLTWTGEPLAEDVVICGRPIVRLVLAATEDDPAPPSIERIVTRLAVVDPTGASAFITAGVSCPGQPMTSLDITMRAVNYRVRAGNRLRLVVGDADFPRLMPLAKPQEFFVSEADVHFPVLTHEGDEIDMPMADAAADVSSRSPEWGGRWIISRDLVHDSIEVTIGVANAGNPPGQANLLDYQGVTRASVRRTAPGAARLDGEYVATARMATGETVVAKTTVRLTQTTLVARGEVEVDGLPVFTRSWDAVLPGDHR